MIGSGRSCCAGFQREDWHHPPDQSGSTQVDLSRADVWKGKPDVALLFLEKWALNEVSCSSTQYIGLRTIFDPAAISYWPARKPSCLDLYVPARVYDGADRAAVEPTTFPSFDVATNQIDAPEQIVPGKLHLHALLSKC